MGIELSVVIVCDRVAILPIPDHPSVLFSLSCHPRLSRTTFFIWRRLFPPTARFPTIPEQVPRHRVGI